MLGFVKAKLEGVTGFSAFFSEEWWPSEGDVSSERGVGRAILLLTSSPLDCVFLFRERSFSVEAEQPLEADEYVEGFSE